MTVKQRKRKKDDVACKVVGPHPIDGVKVGGTVYVEPGRVASLGPGIKPIEKGA